MFVDASAIVAILAEESDGAALIARLGQAQHIHTSAIALYEATLALARSCDLPITDAHNAINRFIERSQVEIIPITGDIGRGAIGAFERFGRGRHPARLNTGDCFAYACARSLDVPLLFKGDDFSQTDIPAG
jgi:ribonuclease VapC